VSNKVVLIQVWFGKIPDYFWFHYETTKNIEGYDFLFFTDQDLVVDSQNYKVIKTTMEEIESLISKTLNTKIKIKSNKKTCDLKSSFGDIFQSFITEYDYYGAYDLDTLFGDVSNYVKDFLGEYDVITIADEVYHNRLAGPFLLFKNSEELRNEYKGAEYIKCFESENVECFEEYHLSNKLKNRYKIKYIYSINCETNNGGKTTYDAVWSGGKVYTDGIEKMIYHFHRKSLTTFSKVGNKIYTRYDKKFVDDFYWVFGFTENYSETIFYLLESLQKYSVRRCIIYTINFDYNLPDKFLTSQQFVIRKINIEEGKKDLRGRDENIISCKPKLMIDVVDTYPEKKFIFIDSDVYITASADDISKNFDSLENYPLINSHTHDKLYLCGLVEGEEWTSTVDILASKMGVEITVFPRRKTNVILFDKNSKWFFQEQLEMYDKYKDSEPGIFALHDEDSANVILSKYNFHKCLHLCDIEETDDIEMSKFTDLNHPFHFTGLSPYLQLPKNQNDIVVFHGLKHPQRFKNIQKIYGNKVLDCEEIVIQYINNTMYFEKNSFLDTKNIDEPVDFIIKNQSGDVVEILTNQHLHSYWLFYISNIYLNDDYYHIEIIKSNSKQKIYNNILCTTQLM
jgi:hypothetical protein